MALHRNSKGLDVPIAGAPALLAGAPPTAVVTHVALLASDTPGLRPTLLVEPGAAVRRGQPLFEDKKNPGVRFTSPAAGTVRAVHRGARRAFISVVVELGPEDADPQRNQVAFEWSADLADARPPDRDRVQALLLESGLWRCARVRSRAWRHRAPRPGRSSSPRPTRARMRRRRRWRWPDARRSSSAACRRC
ncbi:MAG: hypothetical protein MUC86_07765 [Burkholderiaceae bacterium]|nr:hypothetical protein [Burkholderiaceae bacterium]